MFGPELIRINEKMNELLKTARSGVSKNRPERGFWCGFFLQRQPRNFENMTLVVERAFPSE